MAAILTRCASSDWEILPAVEFRSKLRNPRDWDDWAFEALSVTVTVFALVPGFCMLRNWESVPTGIRLSRSFPNPELYELYEGKETRLGAAVVALILWKEPWNLLGCNALSPTPTSGAAPLLTLFD